MDDYGNDDGYNYGTTDGYDYSDYGYGYTDGYTPPADTSGPLSNEDILASIFYDPSSYGTQGAQGAAPEATPATPDTGYPGEGGAYGGAAPAAQAATPAAAPQGQGALSIWERISQGLGLSKNKGGKDSGIDISDPATLKRLIQVGAGGLGLINAMNPQGPANQKSPAELRASTGADKYSGWTPEQQASMNAYLQGPVAFGAAKPRIQATMRPLVAGRGYAEGGNVEGPLALVRGGGSGQSDNVEALLSPGEYVFDADTVSALGDGNNEHGAALLDQMRHHIRKHKRSASPDSIPPEAKAPHEYLPRGALSQVKGGA